MDFTQKEDADNQRSSVDKDLLNKFKIQSLEEVTEMTEESKSDTSSHISDVSLGMDDDSSCNSDDLSRGSETIARIKMAEEIKEIEMKAKGHFNHQTDPIIPFKFDFEDFDNCKLNGEIKKMIQYMKITIPIVYVKKTDQYFVGTKKVSLLLKGAFIHVGGFSESADKNKSIRFNQYISENQSLFEKELTFYMMRSKWNLEQVVQSLIDGKKVANVSD